jgi:hypothetical protein
MDADFARMREAAYWIPRTGHSKDEEVEVFETAAARLMADLGVDESTRVLLDTREGLVEYLEGQAFGNRLQDSPTSADVPQTLPPGGVHW